MSNKNVTIYTDGACKGNPGPGGWAYLMFLDSDPSLRKVESGSFLETTNNQMEMIAVINALSSLKEKCNVNLYTDSQYVKNGITLWVPNWKLNNWKTSSNKPVKNVELWKSLDYLFSKHNLVMHYVKAHNGDINNEFVDKLASDAALLGL